MGFVKTDNGEIWSYAQTANHCGFAICEKCSATIPNLSKLREAHEQWHERLRRAVEEREFLE